MLGSVGSPYGFVVEAVGHGGLQVCYGNERGAPFNFRREAMAAERRLLDGDDGGFAVAETRVHLVEGFERTSFWATKKRAEPDGGK